MYAAPGRLTPNGADGLANSFTYTPSLQVSSATGPNGATASALYDGAGRPYQTTSVHGAVTSYTYSGNLVTASVNGRWTRTTLDGLGRTVKVEVGDGGGTKSIVDSEYAACACSPLGKLWRVSQPYAPGGAVYWTTYTYDALGRTSRIDLPGGNGATTYAYAGNTTTVTDAAGKWKRYTVDAMGNLVQVTEPAPEGGTHETYYTYNVLGRLTGVSMPRGGYTQTRAFNYDLATGRLMSATNPETGTVSYTYNGDGTLASKTDAKGQRIDYTYDLYGRLTQTSSGKRSYYDSYTVDGWSSQNAWGGWRR